MPRSFDKLLVEQQTLLQQLASVHEKEVSGLRTEIRRLQDQILRGSLNDPACPTMSSASSALDLDDDVLGLEVVRSTTEVVQSLENQSGGDSDSDDAQRGSVLGKLPKGFCGSKPLSTSLKDTKARECSICKTLVKEDDEVCGNCGCRYQTQDVRRFSLTSETPLQVTSSRPSQINSQRPSLLTDKIRESDEIIESQEVDLAQTSKPSGKRASFLAAKIDDSEKNGKNDVDAVRSHGRSMSHCHPLKRQGSFLNDGRESHPLKRQGSFLNEGRDGHPLRRQGSFLNEGRDGHPLRRQGSFLNERRGRRDSIGSGSSLRHSVSMVNSADSAIGYPMLSLSACSQSFAVTGSQSFANLRAIVQMSHLPLEALPFWHDIMEIHDDNDSDGSQLDAEPVMSGVATGRSMSERASAKNSVGMGHQASWMSGDEGTSRMMRFVRCRSNGIHPDSLFYLGWITFGVTLVCFDLITLPMSCFDIAFLEGTFAMVFACLATLYWTADTCVSFFVGYSLSGEVEMLVRNIASHYLRTWFAIDFLLVFSDWVILGISLVASGTSRNSIVLGRLPLFGRAVRTIRILRLLRVSKLPGALNELSLAVGRLDATSLIMGVGKSVCCILFINHIIACAWFAIGNEMRGGWVAAYNVKSTRNDWLYLYLTSLHWSLTQFTPASMDIFPQNFAERAFAVVVILFALVTFSAFVSSITQSMTQLGKLRGTKARQKASFEQYLRDNNISMYLSAKMRRYVDFQIRLTARGTQSEQDVEMLGKLSDTLRMELHCEVYGPWLIRHAFFLYYRNRHLPGMQRLCHTAVAIRTLCQDDVLFSSGEVGQYMYIIQDGTLEYKRAETAKRAERVEEIYPGPCFSELVLWATWEHRGRAAATTRSKIIVLNAERFHANIMYFKTLQKEVSNYAIRVVMTINDSFEPLDFTDLNLGCQIYDPRAICDMVFQANRQTKVAPQISVEPCEESEFSGTMTGAFAAIIEAVSPRGSVRRSIQSLHGILRERTSGRSSTDLRSVMPDDTGSVNTR